MSAPSAGVYQIYVGYALAADDRPLELSVNGAVVHAPAQTGFVDDGMIHFPRSDSWTHWKRTEAIPVALVNGDNTLSYRTIGSSGANIDGIHLADTFIQLTQLVNSQTGTAFKQIDSLTESTSLSISYQMYTGGGDAGKISPPHRVAFSRVVPY